MKFNFKNSCVSLIVLYDFLASIFLIYKELKIEGDITILKIFNISMLLLLTYYYFFKDNVNKKIIILYFSLVFAITSMDLYKQIFINYFPEIDFIINSAINLFMILTLMVFIVMVIRIKFRNWYVF